MKTLPCDILVAGAGPAGSAAARSAALAGLRVLVAERRPAIGVPVRCAEYIPAPLLGEAGTGRSFVVQRVRGMRTILPSGETKETAAPGFTIHRDRFDRCLADAARKAGARFLLNTRVLSRDGRDVILKSGAGALLRARPGVIIGADGPHSTVGRWIGSVNRRLLPAVQVRAVLARPMEMTEVYFDRRFFGGYAWLFPKGSEANVGLGIRRASPRRSSPRKLLEYFVDRLIREGKIRRVTGKYFAGWIPAGPPRKVTGDRILLAGDAAGHTHPITGAGVFQAVAGGRMAGEWAARAVEQDRPEILAGYESQWRDLFEDTLQRAADRRRLLEEQWERLDDIIRYCWIAYREYYRPVGGEAETGRRPVP